MRSASLAFLIGVLLCLLWPELPDAAGAILLLVTLPAAWRYPRYRLVFLVISGCLWAIFRAGLILTHAVDPRWEAEDVVLEGLIASVPEQTERGLRFELLVESLNHEGKSQDFPVRVVLSWFSKSASVRPGERWRLQARLKRPHGFVNPGGFDYEGWLFQRRIRATGHVRDGAVNARIAEAGVRGGIDRARQDLRDAIAAALPGSANQGTVAALAIGVTEGMSRW